MYAIWESVKAFFTWWATPRGSADQRTDFQMVLEGHDRLQSTMQKRIDDLVEEVKQERMARSIEIAAEREGRIKDGKITAKRFDKMAIQLTDCMDRDRRSQETIKNLLIQLAANKVEIEQLRSRMDDYDSGETKAI